MLMFCFVIYGCEIVHVAFDNVVIRSEVKKMSSVCLEFRAMRQNSAGSSHFVPDPVGMRHCHVVLQYLPR